jgi:exo-1,4-beta-D-glucosaminidase
MGAHPLYRLEMKAAVDGVISDEASASFGIRSVSSHLTPQGYTQFVVNGKPVLIRGAGWAPDMFLRDDPKRMEAEFSYVRNLGLNTIRSEGKLEDSRFYDLADRDGIMILPAGSAVTNGSRQPRPAASRGMPRTRRWPPPRWRARRVCCGTTPR